MSCEAEQRQPHLPNLQCIIINVFFYEYKYLLSYNQPPHIVGVWKSWGLLLLACWVVVVAEAEVPSFSLEPDVLGHRMSPSALQF